MEHPLVGDLNDLNLDQLSATITDLHKKLAVATRVGNAHLCHQLRMALESYQNKYHEKLQASYRAQDQQDFSDKINIEK